MRFVGYLRVECVIEQFGQGVGELFRLARLAGEQDRGLDAAGQGFAEQVRRQFDYTAAE